MLQLIYKPYIFLLGASYILAGMTAPPPVLANPNPVFPETSNILEQPAAATEVTPSTVQPKQAMPVQFNGRVLVMLDPGHGGKDSGAIGVDGLREVDVILPIALRVSEILNKSGVATKLTRDRDYFVGLDERVQMSSKEGANIFVSIHANSIDNRPDVHGLETYHYKVGEELANTVHNRIVSSFNTDFKIPLNDRGVRSARFLVLRKSGIPAILVETGYLSSPEEVISLGKTEYREKMAEAIAAGILDYLSKTASRSSNTTRHS